MRSADIEGSMPIAIVVADTQIETRVRVGKVAHEELAEACQHMRAGAQSLVTQSIRQANQFIGVGKRSRMFAADEMKGMQSVQHLKQSRAFVFVLAQFARAPRRLSRFRHPPSPGGKQGGAVFHPKIELQQRTL